MMDEEAFYSMEESNADIRSSDQLENDQISPGEEGFMKGYDIVDEDGVVDNPYADDE